MAEWENVQLSEVLIERKETPYPVALEIGEIRIVSKIGFNTGELEFRDSTATKTKMIQFQPGDIVFSDINATKGAIAIYPNNAEKPASATNHYSAYVVNPKRADGTFLWWLFRSAEFQHILFRTLAGGIKTELKSKQLLPISVNLPSLSEQRRIVTKINSFLTKINEVRVLREQLETELSVFVSSVYRDILKPRKGWVIKSVSELCDKPQYGYTASATTEQIGPHLLRITDIQNGSVNWDTVPYCDCPKPQKYFLHKDDILFARTGATTGKSFLVEECPTAVFASYLIRLRVQKLVTPQYLYAFFQSPSYWEQISASTVGSAQPNCNATKLANLKVPIPSPDEQRNIVTYLSNFQEKVNRIKTLQAQTAHELDGILPSVLDRIFRKP
jgi:type I restriction enzyme S subunit